MPSIFITGAGGCVGHYLVDQLTPEYELYLLVRNPAKLRFDPEQRKNITVLKGDLDQIVDFAGVLSRVDYCIHAATAWGGEGTERINVRRVHELFGMLNPERIRRVIYFSTASILGRDMRPLPEAEEYGTEYVRTKYRCYMGLPQIPCYERIVTVFPTLIFGGDATHPFSNLSLSLPALRRYSGLLGRINIPLRFHFIHAQDIAKIVRYLLEEQTVAGNYVLGNKPISLGDFTRRAAQYFGHPVRWQIRFTPALLYRLALICGARMSDWDRFCVRYGNFEYPATDCASLGLASNYKELEQILADWRLVEASRT